MNLPIYSIASHYKSCLLQVHGNFIAAVGKFNEIGSLPVPVQVDSDVTTVHTHKSIELFSRNEYVNEQNNKIVKRKISMIVSQ